MMHGKVSVIIPTYQSINFISAAIDSVLSQTHKDFEIIVVDDGSTDGTYDFLKEKYNEKINLVRQTNKGLASARNTGLKYSNGEFIQFLDADDILNEEKFCIQINKLIETGADIVTCSYQELYENGEMSDEISYCSTGFDQERIIFENVFGPPHVPIFRKNILFKTGALNTGFHNYCADWAFWLKAVYTECSVTYVEKVLCIYRRHSGSLTISNKYNNSVGDINVLLLCRDLNYQKKVFSYHDIDNSIAAKNLNAVLLLPRGAILKRVKHILAILHYARGKTRIKLTIKSILNIK